jgi:hypothetical protein
MRGVVEAAKVQRRLRKRRWAFVDHREKRIRAFAPFSTHIGHLQLLPSPTEPV